MEVSSLPSLELPSLWLVSCTSLLSLLSEVDEEVDIEDVGCDVANHKGGSSKPERSEKRFDC